MVGGLIDCDIHTVTVMVTVHLSCHLFFWFIGCKQLDCDWGVYNNTDLCWFACFLLSNLQVVSCD